MQRYLVIHYGEIYLKGDNRRYFVHKLAANIKNTLHAFKPIDLQYLAGRLIIRVQDDWDLDKLQARLKQVFGIENFCLAWNSEQDLASIGKNLLSLIKDKQFKTFRVTARRLGSAYPLNSLQLASELGAVVVGKMKKKVSLEKWDLNCYVDIVHNYAFIYFAKELCRGGLPVGVAGKLLCLISGGIDSPVAANLMQKRGAEISYVHFHSYPATPLANQEKVEDLVKVLNKYQKRSYLHLVPFLEVQKAIVNQVPPEYRVIYYRRMMLRIACQIAQKADSQALITGDSLGQVASQTLENISAISQATNLQILRPCIGLNKEEIVTLAKQIGTLEISNQPFADCCSLFTPQHPVTKADLNLILDQEKKWIYQPLLDQALAQSTIKIIK